MFKSFLLETSIHGLKYLVASKNSLCKLLWLMSIVGSFTAASVIIYFNVVDWNNSPAVVTSVDTVEVEGLDQPMLTLCPNNPSIYDLIR